MSSAEAEIYSATSATSDAVLLFHCIRFAVGEGTDVRVHLAMDNAAGRSFFYRSGVGRIRHKSLRVLWVQAKVKDGFVSVGKVPTKDNASELGTKRLSRDNGIPDVSLQILQHGGFKPDRLQRCRKVG